MAASANMTRKKRPEARPDMVGVTPIEIERLGRERPEVFKTIWAELGFCFSILGSMMMAEYFISGFNIVLPTLASALSIPTKSRTWPASVFSLITGALLLPIGRLADIYGGYVVFLSGLMWFLVWSLVAGFSQNYMMLIFCRALQGLGPAAFLPSGIMLLGSVYRPGPRKNLIFSLYGAFSPIGFFLGIFVGGLSGQYLPWGWYFWIGTVLLGLVIIVAWLSVPSDRLERRSNDVEMDWLGAALIVPGLILTVFSLTDSSLADRGWATPYIYVTLVLGCLCIGAATYVEGWTAKTPLLPFDIFKVECMKPLVISLFFSYGVFGIYLFYVSFYLQNVLHISPLQTTAWFAPMAAGGLILATVGGFILHLFPGNVLLAISGVGYVLCVLLFAVIPNDPNYWAFIFPAMICATLGVDVTFSTSNVFITTSMTKHQQGLAGALINTIYFIGVSFCLGVANIAVTSTEHVELKESYKVAFWFGVACAAVALLLLVGFVKIEKAKSDLTVDEKAELEAELMQIRSTRQSATGEVRLGSSTQVHLDGDPDQIGVVEHFRFIPDHHDKVV